MDSAAVLAAYDEQVRRNPGDAGPDGRFERNDAVVRRVPDGDGWAGVLWSDLRAADADAVIAGEVERFAELTQPWEWKYYSYDQPPDLPERLRAAGFTPEPTEALLVAEIAGMALDLDLPQGVHLREVVDEKDVAALVSVHDEVFGEDHSHIGRALLAGLAQRPRTIAAVVATAGDIPVSAGRVEFHLGTEFASLWGGGTLPAWRRRGVFRALVAHRATAAAASGFRYLQVDATTDSQPILRRLGFVDLATTTPFLHPGRVQAPTA